ncbi:hypothetical protein EPI10_024808 [Gossypium australe]|uniref:RVP_2 domain-containing protein n=1 Tax=Gossypium australe TaxID=47621 RepID=A0A5B6VYN5_9ROSI|nr:hypothetical protein EPI10_024808 [Gossypium australe]
MSDLMGQLEWGPVRVGSLRYLGKCWSRIGACLRCGSLECRIRECPLRADQVQAPTLGLAQPQRVVQQPPRGRGQARGSNDIGRGQRAPSRSDGQTEARQPALGLSIESTFSEFTVISLLGQFVQVSKLYKDFPLEVQGEIFLANLMELSFGEFDLILRIDWLVEHRVSLDCASKRVVLKTKDDVEMLMIGEHRDYLSHVISALVAEKLVWKGCEACLAYGLFCYEYQNVKDFSDVFPEELPSLPLNREVEFGIEILSGTAPVSIAPYRMAPKELTQLNA